MKLSLEDALRISKELWTWKAETGSMDLWPGFRKYGAMRNDCPLCEYASQQPPKKRQGICLYCPYYQKFGHCVNKLGGTKPSFDRWCMARTDKTRKKYAKLFLGQIERL